MARHRSPGGEGPTPALDEALRDAAPRTRGAHRLPPPPSALRGRVAIAAVAAGAFVAAGQTLDASANTSTEGVTPLANGRDAAAAMGMGGSAPAPEVLPVAKTGDPSVEVQKLGKSGRIQAERAAREAEARKPLFVKPAEGTFTSGYGGRWGTFHWGVDIANRIGTPIYSVAEGVVISSGPASGFGLWVRVQHTDGTITVYGHVDRTLVREGQKVAAGQQIATMGNRGFSTGPHLHFEVWNAGNQKINPLPWLAERGIALT
ncbi:Peptidase family M23 [Streptoalloteichus tenebrarius]|uniref:Peptidase family M23 n=1 Tax=Streptoalloteichus tenebrarius (strain ATCC 17920 / DSM 40477 / JCM 4838 / CBS 697.72 / NBRC 16177 / NCIMB 11028 / NRRL B-12390 / A12253. 1 / ISP 5477) TaxID=1933 RepID=A0ABT1I1B7_STRSD|nr:M23 family metallopeptidase [Streptoalloteichus tenebrarius]MCP2261572.1 Peptidase family M23 [Streptoalloteichus tenebrarius]BFF02653.1 M23 family metallopeptidase [Streptoalloteichus tenebrarius]